MSFTNERFHLDLLTYRFFYYMSIIIEFIYKYLFKYSAINAKLMQTKFANFSHNIEFINTHTADFVTMVMKYIRLSTFWRRASRF